MRVHVPEVIADLAGLTEESCLVEIACALFAQRHLPFGPAIRLSGLTRAEVERKLAKRDADLSAVGDLRSSVETLRKLGRS